MKSSGTYGSTRDRNCAVPVSGSAWRRHHEWGCEQWKRLQPPLLTCEPILTEAAFLLKREGRETDPLFALLERGVLRVGLEVEDQMADLRALMRRYRPLADIWAVYDNSGEGPRLLERSK